MLLLDIWESEIKLLHQRQAGGLCNNNRYNSKNERRMRKMRNTRENTHGSSRYISLF